MHRCGLQTQDRVWLWGYAQRSLFESGDSVANYQRREPSLVDKMRQPVFTIVSRNATVVAGYALCMHG